MNKFTIAFIALIGSGCTVHAHTPPPSQRPPAPPVVRHTPHPHTHNVSVNVRAWVWVRGHRTPRGVWVHGYWDLRTVPRQMLSRQPHTHVRYIQGRGRPHPPARRYR